MYTTSQVSYLLFLIFQKVFFILRDAQSPRGTAKCRWHHRNITSLILRSVPAGGLENYEIHLLIGSSQSPHWSNILVWLSTGLLHAGMIFTGLILAGAYWYLQAWYPQAWYRQAWYTQAWYSQAHTDIHRPGTHMHDIDRPDTHRPDTHRPILISTGLVPTGLI